MYWIISTDLGSRSRIKEFVDILKNKNQNIIKVGLEDALNPDWKPIINSNRAFLYGHIGFVNRLNGLFTPGVIGHSEFTLENIFKNVPGDCLLNDKISVVTSNASDILKYFKLENNIKDMYFFKPGNDQKLFAGGPHNVDDIICVCEAIRDGILPDSTPDFPLILGELYGIESEYRFFVVGHKPVAWSQYAKKQEYYTSPHVPDNVKEFALSMIDIWSPVEGYVLDIGLSNGKPYVIEYQGINSSGFYDCNLNDLIDACIEQWGQ